MWGERKGFSHSLRGQTYPTKELLRNARQGKEARGIRRANGESCGQEAVEPPQEKDRQKEEAGSGS
jgi:hypothetical protein